MGARHIQRAPARHVPPNVTCLYVWTSETPVREHGHTHRPSPHTCMSSNRFLYSVRALRVYNARARSQRYLAMKCCSRGGSDKVGPHNTDSECEAERTRRASLGKSPPPHALVSAKRCGSALAPGNRPAKAAAAR